MMMTVEIQNPDQVSEYELKAVTDFPVIDLNRDYSEVQAFFSDFFLYEKQRHPELLPLMQILTPTPVMEKIKHLSTDGEHLYYSPKYIREVMERYDDDIVRHILSKQLMHILMHGLLGHFGSYYEDEKLAWAIEDLLSDRFLSLFMYPNSCEESSDDNKLKTDELLEKGMGAYYKIKPMKKSRQYLMKQGQGVRSDNHRLWRSGSLSKWEQAIQDILNGLPSEIREKLRQINIQVVELKDLDLSALCFIANSISSSVDGNYGTMVGSEGMMVSSEQTSRMSYTDTLRELFIEKEHICEEPDSIDPMFYQYGLELYEDMPLIESLEENYRPVVENIVFAIDTSGSCVSVAAKFISETCKILSDADEIGQVGAVTMLQCDCCIQRVQEFENGSDLNKYLDKSVEMGGFGGTSFVPVFDWIEEKQRQTGQEVSALIYLTDGIGAYPDKRPDYPVYFVLPDTHPWMVKEVKKRPWIYPLVLK